jgi:outer membrane protein assembly factor BamB
MNSLNEMIRPRLSLTVHAIRLLAACFAAGTALSAELPGAQEYQANWPRFRGPTGGGVSMQPNLPLTCDVGGGANIAWSSPVPAAGYSSPVVWGNRVFLSGGEGGKPVVMCFDAGSGKLLWQQAAPKAEGAAEPPESADLAASTVATDGQRVYAIFANGDLAAFDFDGKAAWSKHFGVPKNQYGHATSLITWKDRVVVQLDQGEADDHLSKLYALDGASGKVVWEQPRPAGASWATPLVMDVAGKPQIVTLAVPWVIAYAAQDGAEIWRANDLDGEVTPSPIFAGGTLFVVSPSSKLQAIRPDGQGDVTKTHLGWVGEDGIPDITSPVSNGELVFVVDTSGVLTCYDAKSGRKQWEHDFGDEVKASPSIAGTTLYLITKKGTLITAEAARQFKELGRSELGEDVFASPAFAQGKIIIRGMKHLFCIGSKNVAAKP